MPDINLNPFTAESAAIQRRLQMAQALGQQALQPVEVPQQAGVRASPYMGLAKMLQGYMAGSEEKSAAEAYKDLAERYQAGNRAEMGSFLEAMQGAPERAPRLDPQEVQQMADQGTPMPLNIPAVAPDRQRAMALALGSQNPTLQGAGGAMLSSMMTPKAPINVAPGGTLYDQTTGKPIFTAPEKEDYHQPRNEFDPTSGQTLTVSYSNKGNRKVIDTKGAFTPDQWNSIPVAERARLIFDQYKFGNVSATDMMQAAQKNVQLGQEFAKLGFDIGKNTSAGGVNIPGNAPMPALPLNGMPQPVSNVPVSGAPAVPVAPPAGGRYTPFNAPQRAATPPTPTTPTNVAPQPESNLIIDQVTPKERQVLLVAKPQAITGATTSLQNIDRLTNVAKELSDHPGLSRITGKLNQFSTFDTTAEATSARALQSTLVKQAAVNALQSMREASKTGGAVGSVTESEWPILEQQLAALDGAQKPQDYKIALTNLQAQLKSSSERIRNAYEMTYGPLPYTAPQYTTQGRDAPPAGAVRRIR
jgi:hypothetical protein